MNRKVITITVNINDNSKKLNNEKIIDNKILELEKLVQAVDDQAIMSVVQNKNNIDKSYYIGKGKALEVKEYCKKLDVDLVVFNNELTGSQVRNLEDLMDVEVVDRTNLILDIFNQRAKTKQAKLQVKLAKLKYTLPRLSMLRSGFSRQQGGIGSKGVGEQQIELDKRTINSQIISISSALKEIEKNRNETRKKRITSKNKIISLVGYTNAGKSTLINKLISYGKEDTEEVKEVFVKDMLFATLDTFIREGRLLSGQNVMYVDTVGFVSDIPHNLVESFKSTLEEIKYSDLLLHVIDVSDINVDKQIEVTKKMIKELGCEQKDMLYIFNKSDKISNEDIKLQFANIKNKIFISAKDDKDIILLLKEIEKILFPKNFDKKLLIPYDKQQLVNKILSNYVPQKIEYISEGTLISLSLNEKDYEIYKRYDIND